MCSVPSVLEYAPRPLVLALAGALVLSLGGCDDAPKGPEEVAERFMALTQAGGPKARAAAWALLTPAAQETLRARARALAEAAGESPKEDGAQILARLDLEVVASPGTATVVSPPGERATVRFSGGSGKLHLERVDGRWRVDLWASLVPTSTATAPPPRLRE